MCAQLVPRELQHSTVKVNAIVILIVIGIIINTRINAYVITMLRVLQINVSNVLI